MGFVAQLGVALGEYPPDVVEAVTSPGLGIQRKLKFPPSIEEMLEECEWWMGIRGGAPERAKLRERIRQTRAERLAK